MYSYKSLVGLPYSQLADCFNLAFSDYFIPMKLSAEGLKVLFEMSCVDRALSYGAFVGDEMVGFIFNSCGIYNKQRVVFDVGTGVIPEHRGRRVFTNLFKFAEQELKNQQVEKYYLEVLQQNDRAIASYKKQGFEVVREFHVLKSVGLVQERTDLNVEYCDLEEFDFGRVSSCACLSPSYEHSTEVIMKNPSLYRVAYSLKDGNVTAFCVFTKNGGRVIQLGYADIGELRLVIRCVMAEYKNIVVKNLDSSYTEVLEIFLSLGFTEMCRQFEMVKRIG